MIQGESYSIGILFNSDYDKSRIEDMELCVGNVVVAKNNDIVLKEGIYRCQLSSSQTRELCPGKRHITLHLQDRIMGVVKPVVATIEIKPSYSKKTSQSTNSGLNLLVEVKIDETVVVENVTLANILKGEDGKDFTYEDFTAEQIEEFKRPAVEAATAVQTELSNLATLKTETAQAVENANTATSNANAAAENANEKAQLAQTAATEAATKIEVVDEKLQEIGTATSLANTATENATSATENVEAAISNAATQADYAKSQGDAAKEKAEEATNTLTQANQVKADLEEYKSNLQELKWVLKIKNIVTFGSYDVDSNGDGIADKMMTYDKEKFIFSISENYLFGQGCQKIEAKEDVKKILTYQHQYVEHDEDVFYHFFSFFSTVYLPALGITTIGEFERKGSFSANKWHFASALKTEKNDGKPYINKIFSGDFEIGDYILIDGEGIINLTEAFGAGNEPTASEMDALLEILGVNYFEGELTLTDKQIALWQLNLIRKNNELIKALING